MSQLWQDRPHRQKLLVTTGAKGPYRPSGSGQRSCSATYVPPARMQSGGFCRLIAGSVKRHWIRRQVGMKQTRLWGKEFAGILPMRQERAISVSQPRLTFKAKSIDVPTT